MTVDEVELDEVNKVTQGGKNPEALSEYLFPGGVSSTLSTVGGANTVKKADETMQSLIPQSDKAKAEAMGIDTNTSGWLDRYNAAAASKTAPESEEKSTDGDLASIFKEDAQLQKAGTELTAAQAEAQANKKILADLSSEIDSYKITDAQLNDQISGITARWNNRIQEMEDVNARREKAFETLGFRIGSRFTGGVKGGVFGGVIAEEERQGVLRIGDLEAKKQSEISEAKTAQRKQNWDVYVEKVNQAQDIYDKQLATVKDLNEKYLKRQKELEDEKKAADKIVIQASRDSAIANLVDQGITDPTQLLDYLNFNEEGAMVGDITLKEITDSLEMINKARNASLTGLSTELRDFKAFYPDIDLKTEDGMNQYLRWKALMNPVEQWSDPYSLGGDLVQKNMQTGEIRTAVNVASGGGAKNKFTFSSDDRGQLLNVGLTDMDINNIQSDIGQYGTGAVLQGLSEEQQTAVRNILSGKTIAQLQADAEAGKQFLNRDYFKNLYTDDQLGQAAKDAGFTAGGFLGIGVGSKGKENYLDYLDGLIKQYRNAGYTDKEILSMMQ